jgi:hypothetical protein
MNISFQPGEIIIDFPQTVAALQSFQPLERFGTTHMDCEYFMEMFETVSFRASVLYRLDRMYRC